MSKAPSPTGGCVDRLQSGMHRLRDDAMHGIAVIPYAAKLRFLASLFEGGGPPQVVEGVLRPFGRGRRPRRPVFYDAALLSTAYAVTEGVAKHSILHSPHLYHLTKAAHTPSVAHSRASSLKEGAFSPRCMKKENGA